MKDQLANKIKGEKALAIAKQIERPVIRLGRGVTGEMLRPRNLVYVRPGKNTREEVIRLHNEGKTTNEIAAELRVTKQNVHHHLKMHKKETK